MRSYLKVRWSKRKLFTVRVKFLAVKKEALHSAGQIFGGEKGSSFMVRVIAIHSAGRGGLTLASQGTWPFQNF